MADRLYGGTWVFSTRLRSAVGDGPRPRASVASTASSAAVPAAGPISATVQPVVKSVKWQIGTARPATERQRAHRARYSGPRDGIAVRRRTESGRSGGSGDAVRDIDPGLDRHTERRPSPTTRPAIALPKMPRASADPAAPLVDLHLNGWCGRAPRAVSLPRGEDEGTRRGSRRRPPRARHARHGTGRRPRRPAK